MNNGSSLKAPAWCMAAVLIAFTAGCGDGDTIFGAPAGTGTAAGAPPGAGPIAASCTSGALPLGSATSFGVLALTSITNANPTSVVGDVGSPSITVPPSTLVGTLYDGNCS